MADHARTQHVGDQFVALAIPDKQRRAGTAAAVDLGEVLLPVARNIYFILQDAGGPQHANDVSLFRIAESNHDVGGVLPQVSRRSGDLKLLPVSAREHLDFGADGALVVGQSLQRQAQPVILIAAFVAQQHGRTMILGDQQVSRTVAIVIAGNDGARLFELNLVETNVGGDVLETIRPEIAEQPHLALALFGFADGDQIDPAIVVVVDGGNTECVNPVGFWQRNTVEAFAMIVAPQRDARRSPVCESQVHPAVVIEIKNGDAHGLSRHWRRPRLSR